MDSWLSRVLLATAAAVCLLLGAQVNATSYQIKAVTKPVIMSESPYWCQETQTVIFVDIIGQLVLRYDPAHPDDLKNVSLASHDESGRVSPAVPVQGSHGTQLVVGVGRTVHLLDVDWGDVGQPATILKNKALVEVESALPDNRFNDGKADSAGRLWIGTMDNRQTSRRRRRAALPPNKGELFRFDLKLHAVSATKTETRAKVTAVETKDLAIPNGMAWTADGKTYYLADSTEAAIYRYDFYPEQGTLGNRTVVFRFIDAEVPGTPDGLTLDEEGNLWIACVHGGRVIQVNPRTGQLLQTIKMNVTNVSAVEWGGERHDVLYVTSSRYQMDGAQLEREPEAGCMFTITGLGTRGLNKTPYPVTVDRSGSWRLSYSSILSALVFFLSLRSAASNTN